MLDERDGADNFAATYAVDEWSRADIDALSGVALLEFGTAWCPICRAAQPLIRTVVAEHPGIRHVKVEDGPGRPLGRSFRVKLWPTLILLKEGCEVRRVVRPRSAPELRELLSAS
jgi:thioredoxin 1